jgi:hypothetical protein
VLLVALVVLAAFDLAAFDVAGVAALRSYLTGQADSGLRQVTGVCRLTSRLAAASQRRSRPGQIPGIDVPKGSFYAAHRYIHAAIMSGAGRWLRGG